MTEPGLLDLDEDRLREECGVFGIFGHPDAAAITALGLHALQHRGQEAAGIVSFDGKRFHSERRLGLVGDAFSRREVIDRLPGNAAVGHVRYSTTGETILRNVQPLFAELNAGGFAVGHNGNLTNGLTLRRQLVREGAMMQSTTDTEVILHLVARSHRNRFVDRFDRRAAPARRLLRLRRPHQQETGRCPRSARHPAAGARQTRRLSDPCVRDLRTRHHRCAICARRRERRGARLRRRRRAFAQAVPARWRRDPASSSTSISRGRTPSSAAEASTMCARPAARSSRARRPLPPMWSFRCPIPACRPRSAMRRRPAFLTNSASSAITTSAAPSSSRRSRSARLASASSTAPTAPW